LEQGSDKGSKLAAKLAQTTFAFGGERANITPYTAALNTLFLREHNRLAGMLEDANPDWDDERVFQTARNINIVLLIKIVVEEYINHISPYHFQLAADPSVAWRAVWNRPNWIPLEFNLLYRWHSMTPDQFAIAGEYKPVKECLQDNSYLTNLGLAETLATASRQNCWKLGLFNTAEFLLPVEKATITQSRENQIGSYNDYREAFKYPRVTKFEQITGDKEKIKVLRSLYRDVENIEFFVGLLAEDIAPRAAVPPLIGRMVAFDAFSHAFTNPLLSKQVFNEQTFTQMGMETIHATCTLQDVLDRNLAPGEARTEISMSHDQPSAARA
jgi:prostaglandin-endoperoxide synthase 2